MINQNQTKVESISIAVADPARIKYWAERKLPNGEKVGEVTNSKTVNYENLKPEKGGLFCEKIFGPIKDFECSCGNKQINTKNKFCASCDVEFTSSQVRRYRLGYIKLASPVVHSWYFKGRPSFISLLLECRRKHIEALLYTQNKFAVAALRVVRLDNDLVARDQDFISQLPTASLAFLPVDKTQKKNRLAGQLPTDKNRQATLKKSGVSSKRSFLPTFTQINKNTTLINQINKNTIECNLQNNLVDAYFISKLKYNYNKNKIFQIKLTNIFYTSYFQNFDILKFESVENLKLIIYIFVPFLENQHAKNSFIKLNNTLSTNKKLLNKVFYVINLNNCFASCESVLSNSSADSCSSLSVPFLGTSSSQKNTMEADRLTTIPTNNSVENNRCFNFNVKKNIFLNENLSKNLTKKTPSQLPTSVSLTGLAGQLTSSNRFLFNTTQIFLVDFSNFLFKKRKKLKNSNETASFIFNRPANQSLTNSNQITTEKFFYKTHYFYPVPGFFFFEEVVIRKPSPAKILVSDYFYTLFYDYISAPHKQGDIVVPIYKTQFFHEDALIKMKHRRYNAQSRCLTGYTLLRHLLKNVNLRGLKVLLRQEIAEIDDEIFESATRECISFRERAQIQKMKQDKFKKLRRFKVASYFINHQINPEWVILSNLPVLPPALRPIVKLDTGNQVAVSDLNQLYKRVIDRNNRISRRSHLGSQSQFYAMQFHERLLQEAVDALIENGKGGAPLVCATNGRPYKSLSDVIKSKKGRFRQNLLGKRVDFSGRSVIVVAPELQLHECGLPREMAIELFQPFIMRALIKQQTKTKIIKIKKLITTQPPIIWKILEKILKRKAILLNRAPTLHRLGIQAFQAKLVDGRAILLHPLVCTAFNADFDGDQMAVHVPLSGAAQAEVWRLMLSTKNILSPATGQPIIVPSQDMILGCYYLTTNLNDKNSKLPFHSQAVARIANKEKSSYMFSTIDEVLLAFYQKKILLHSLIWLHWKNFLQIENFYEKPLEIRIDFFGNTIQIYSKYWRRYDNLSNPISQFIYTTTGRVLFNKAVLESVIK